MSTVGYGDIYCHTYMGRLFNILFICVGLVRTQFISIYLIQSIQIQLCPKELRNAFRVDASRPCAVNLHNVLTATYNTSFSVFKTVSLHSRLS